MDVTGKWYMVKVLQDGSDVTMSHVAGDRYLILKEDSTFESGGTSFDVNTGTYSFNEADSLLFLDSDVGDNDDSYWKVLVRNDTMFWSGFGTDWAERFQIVQVRAK